MNAADKYYIIAKDNYPYQMDEALEALEYGLSHDPEHPGLLTLQGDIYFRDLEQFVQALECYELALLSNPSFIPVYYSFLQLALKLDMHTRVEKLIDAAKKTAGINPARIAYYQSLLYEKLNRYADAVNNLRLAEKYSQCKEEYAFIEKEIERIEQKDKKLKEYKSSINIILTS
jgi:tetratricopeptide (TPR) repeat protein